MKYLYITLGTLLLLCLILLITNTRILVYEKYKYVGEEKFIDCSYFTGRNIVNKEYWYASNDIMGKDSCPFIASQ